MTAKQLKVFNKVNEQSTYSAICCDDWAFQMCHHNLGEPKIRIGHACTGEETWKFVSAITKTCECGATLPKTIECALTLQRLDI